MSVLVEAARRHPFSTKFLWFAACVAIGQASGDILVALGYSL